MRRRRLVVAVPAVTLALLLLASLVVGPADAPVVAPAAAQLLPPGARVDEITLAAGGRVRALGIATSAEGLSIDGPTGRRTVVGVEAAGPVTSRTVWLGTDRQGRDLAARLAGGARTSLSVAAIAAAVAVLLGTLIGIGSAAAGALASGGLRLGVDATLALPRMLLLFMLGAALRGSVVGIGLAVGLVSWMAIARVVDAECRALMGREFVQASRALGIGRLRLALRHLLPHLLPVIRTALPVAATEAVLLEATLSFFGFGMGAGADSWGAMIADGRQLMPAGWWIALFPGLLVATTALAFHGLATALRSGSPRRTVLEP